MTFADLTRVLDLHRPCLTCGNPGAPIRFSDAVLPLRSFVESGTLVPGR